MIFRNCITLLYSSRSWNITEPTMKAVILLSVIAVAFATECGENEHYENCGVDCFVTCENYQKPPRACILRCDLGCQCDKGYVRSADGRCVRPEQCPGSSPKQCGENQHYESCGTACPLTCKNYANPPKACVLMCNPGCHCDKGFVKTDDGECVRPEQCPAHDVPVCGENQRYLECGTACPLTCDNYDNPPRICPLMCVAGCHCEPGFVKTNDGRCVRVENCPNKASAELCSLPAKVGLCRGYFPRFFFNQETGKCEKFIYGGCGGNSNNFKTEEECHNTCECGENEHFVNCGTAYPLTCENYQDPPKSYVVKGGIGCRCHKGYVRSGDGRCVRPEQCPGSAPKPVCGKNQRYLECGTACPLTCDNYDNPPRICIDMCVTGCHCEPGYVKTRDGRCVRVEDCPSKGATPEFCNLPAERGMCHAYFPRYFYNQETGKCENFYYGGCAGNENNFSTEEECQSICGSS